MKTFDVTAFNSKGDLSIHTSRQTDEASPRVGGPGYRAFSDAVKELSPNPKGMPTTWVRVVGRESGHTSYWEAGWGIHCQMFGFQEIYKPDFDHAFSQTFADAA